MTPLRLQSGSENITGFVGRGGGGAEGMMDGFKLAFHLDKKKGPSQTGSYHPSIHPLYIRLRILSGEYSPSSVTVTPPPLIKQQIYFYPA